MWPCYRLVLEGWATLIDVQTRLSFDDVLLANEALDAYQDAQRRSEALKAASVRD